VKSAVLPSFWEAYRRLDRTAQEKARKSFQVWMDDPFHPSLHFKCINSGENFTWFWIGGFTDYERYNMH
jgi:hypothetical protein